MTTSLWIERAGMDERPASTAAFIAPLGLVKPVTPVPGPARQV
jgi:hypothetical protein